MNNPKNKPKKDKLLFIGCLPSSNDLPAQFPENGGRAPAMIKWYTRHAKLDPSESLVLRDIVAELNFNDFYGDWRTINQCALADGINIHRVTVNKAIQSLKEQGVLETLKLPNNIMKFRLTRKIPDGYIAYLKESCPHKFPSETAVSEIHPCSPTLQPLVVSHYKPLLSHATTSYLSYIPENHPDLSTFVNVIDNSDHNARACMDVDGRLNKEVSPEEKIKRKSWELSQAIFGLTEDGPEYRKGIYDWMDKILRDYGKFAIEYLEPMAKSSKIWGSSIKIRKRIEEAIKKLKDETIRQKHYQDADDTYSLSNDSYAY